MHSAAFEQDSLAAADQRGFDMGVGITLPVPVTGTVLRDQGLQCQQDIMGHIRIGVFINRNPGRCVRRVNSDLSILNPAFFKTCPTWEVISSTSQRRRVETEIVSWYTFIFFSRIVSIQKTLHILYINSV